MLGLSAALACAYQLAPPLAQPRVPQRRAPPPAASSFAEIGLRGELCAALAEAGITEPNDLQRRVMPALAGRADVLIGARTGSGKTLAYLLPIMQTLRTDEERAGSRARPRRPRALVLLPTRELALQVRDVARSLCRPLKISVAAVHGGVPEGSQKRMLEQPVDLLTRTLTRIRTLTLALTLTLTLALALALALILALVLTLTRSTCSWRRRAGCCSTWTRATSTSATCGTW